MIKVNSKEIKGVGFDIMIDCKKSSPVEKLAVIDGLIKALEKSLDINFKHVLKLIKETRKNVETNIGDVW